MKPTREEALQLFLTYNKTESLIHHGLAVEGVMRHFARLHHEDEDKWGIIGLLHDLDYERYPAEHCIKTREIMAEKGIDEEYIHAIECHGYGLCTEVEPKETMEIVLYTIDELTGLINAAALMRPSKSVLDMEIKSIKKKFKDKGFAAGVNREVIKDGCERLGMPLEEVMTETLAGMKEVADTIGLGLHE